MDEIRRTILKTGAAAATVAAAPQVFAQQTGQGTTKFYERGAVRIAYQEAGSGFPLLLIAGGGRGWARRSSAWVSNSQKLLIDLVNQDMTT
jgi:hypothetical protein